MVRKLISALIIAFFTLPAAHGQISVSDELEGIDYSSPRDFEVGGITISGTEYLDKKVLKLLSGLEVGETITVPGDEITKAIENLWKQGLFADISIRATKVVGDKIFLDIHLQERPRLSAFRFEGARKSEEDDLRDKIKLIKGKVVTENILMTTKQKIKSYYVDKGFLNTEVDITEMPDTNLPNNVILIINIDRKKRVKINEIIFHGNEKLSDRKLKRTMKETKQKRWWSFFKASRFIEDDYEKDKELITAKYNEQGFRDAQILKDSIYKVDEKTINVEIWLREGEKYYFRNIYWKGNTKYTDEQLSKVLGIKKGDVYNRQVLETNLYMNPNGRDVSSLYLDDGYLFFDVQPIEVMVENDSIDLEMQIREGKQAVVNKVTITGNTKTNDHVILREIRTKPGELFSRSDIIRSQRELAQLGYFDQEKLEVNPKPNPADGTVDIEYVVAERPSDQIELSGGWGAGRIVGTLGLSFNNFSARNIFKKGAWRPLPAGDGQRLSVRAQSNGLFFQSYNASFTEPWLGGKKPNSLSVTVYHSVQSNGVRRNEPNRQSIKITGVTVGNGRRLKWPDDFFNLYTEASYQHYKLNNYQSTFAFSDGFSNNFSLKGVFSRNSIDAPIYPRTGSNLSLSLQLTPPYSFMQTRNEFPYVDFGQEDYSTLEDQEKYKWIEYHKWKFTGQWYHNLVQNLVLHSRAQFGFIGLYNRTVGLTPFERFYLGGDGLSGFALDGREIIALRGYGNNTLTPVGQNGRYVGGTIYNKYTLELRYPVSLNPSATIYGLAFLEAGDAWSKFDQFDPFGVKKSAGAGVRVFLPMFGLLGLDWGYGFDEIPERPGENKGQFHFSIGQQF